MGADMLVVLLPWVVATAATPVCARLAQRRGWVDRPGERKAHAAPIPYLGGVAVFAAVVLGIAAAWPWVHGRLDARELGSLGALAACMLALGIYDDLRDLRAPLKLAGQIAIGVATWLVGFQIGKVELPLGWAIAGGPIISLFMTVGWIVVMTNAFNLIDGMDGLASGLAIITALTLFLLATGQNELGAAFVALAMAGALAGFLRFNLPPARIFLGDAGAMSIGYTLAVLSILGFQKSSTAMVVAVPLLIAGIPVLDTTLAVVRRLRGAVREHGPRRVRPADLGRAQLRGDRGHIHHLLLRTGFSPTRALFALYAASATLAGVAYMMEEADATLRWGAVVVVGAIGCVAQPMLERRLERRERGLAAAAETARPDPR
jgi:UDP-GlcNAc:undecaprenyl-phosphate GlcNAc-1-phosphate transferase